MAISSTDTSAMKSIAVKNCLIKKGLDRIRHCAAAQINKEIGTDAVPTLVTTLVGQPMAEAMTSEATELVDLTVICIVMPESTSANRALTNTSSPPRKTPDNSNT